MAYKQSPHNRVPGSIIPKKYPNQQRFFNYIAHIGSHMLDSF